VEPIREGNRPRADHPYTGEAHGRNGAGVSTGQTETLILRGLFGRVRRGLRPDPAEILGGGKRWFRDGGGPPDSNGLPTRTAGVVVAGSERPGAVPGASPAAAPERSRAAAVVRGVGEALITLGVLILLFCVYQLFYTNFEANRAQAKIKDSLERDWTPPQHIPNAQPVPDDFSGIDEGDGFALMYIPRLGRDWQKPVVEGVGLDDLARGVGHYPDSAMPGKVGNFAVAGHRATHGEPFRNLDSVKEGDVVIVETENNWYRYVIDRHRIVDPTDVGVVLPVPNQPGVKPTKKLITLTTCHPRWASTYRLIYWGHLESVMSKSSGTPPELLK
jgi:sortase A